MLKVGQVWWTVQWVRLPEPHRDPGDDPVVDLAGRAKLTELPDGTYKHVWQWLTPAGRPTLDGQTTVGELVDVRRKAQLQGKDPAGPVFDETSTVVDWAEPQEFPPEPVDSQEAAQVA